ncbi:uncharacterized protein LOC122234256 [Panthera tigris]|uniref:uncharacterized protein LOC122234256 n=1 Tax=Panthera tigris TaxID=9694 RepID=UPI001C6FA859|nr:uncharacterized protein LOC122234256 [Panthera tigris]
MDAGRAICDCHSPWTRFPWGERDSMGMLVSLFTSGLGGAMTRLAMSNGEGSDRVHLSNGRRDLRNWMSTSSGKSFGNSPDKPHGQWAVAFIVLRPLKPESGSEAEISLSKVENVPLLSAPASASVWFLPPTCPSPVFPLLENSIFPPPAVSGALQTPPGTLASHHLRRHTWIKATHVPWAVAVTSSLTLRPRLTSSSPAFPPGSKRSWENARTSWLSTAAAYAD